MIKPLRIYQRKTRLPENQTQNNKGLDLNKTDILKILKLQIEKTVTQKSKRVFTKLKLFTFPSKDQRVRKTQKSRKKNGGGENQTEN